MKVALLLLAVAACSQPTPQEDAISPASASGWFSAHQVPQPPPGKRGDAVALPVYFTDQAGIDYLCGGKDQFIACAQIGGGIMVLPNPCQPRFAGESFAAVACHEKGHILGWSHS